ncbi:uncharacterized protein MICPUCDRAFT_64078 [Micromonas pusilla CCMP1545]|uniref:Predicted protein n=1 Tax=Micromonas pusilla (strain CCMP1545) TaxID=564608 RepID=C1MJU5_MICPC|nr:uncharacterized protein MICPUCDRAFT_64078 [Micromonas pusilla CCMP1545]EEH59257.1 predicted protein [Micromonas pusilla CCMP1545]|eukprot:XP_003055881.1 predicted protein [Micromonas pusilla CCMP1545]
MDDYGAWNNFFTEFGTHFVNTLTLGGRMSTTVTMDSKATRKLEEKNVDVAMMVKGEYGPVSASVEASASSDKSSKNEFNDAKKDSKTIISGGTPPKSRADPERFREWAVSVPDHPVPVKYTLKPLTEASPNLDKYTYDIMVNEYMVKGKAAAEARNGHGGDSGKLKTGKLKPGQKIAPGTTVLTSGDDGLKDTGGNMLQLLRDGRLVVKDKFNNILWDSLSIGWDWDIPLSAPVCHYILSDKDGDWGPKTIPGCETPLPGAYTLEYQTNGNLEIKNKTGDRIWHSVTDSLTCSPNAPHHMRFDDGQLSIFNNNREIVWDTATSGAKKANEDQFGPGANKCITSKNCVTIYDDDDFGGNKLELKPGNYDWHFLDDDKDLDQDVNSFEFPGGDDAHRCYIYMWENDGYTGSSQAVTKTTKKCGEENLRKHVGLAVVHESLWPCSEFR